MEFRSLGDSVKGNKYIRDLADCLEGWDAAQDSAGQVEVVTVQLHEPYRERRLASLSLREIPAAELSRILDEDAEARRGDRSTDDGSASGTYSDLRYAALRLNYLMHPDDYGIRPGYGHRHPQDAAEKFGELHRIVTTVSDLVEEADRLLGEELLAERVVPIQDDSSAEAKSPSDVAQALRDDARVLGRMLEDCCRLLHRFQSTASGLERAAAIPLRRARTLRACLNR